MGVNKTQIYTHEILYIPTIWLLSHILDMP